MIPNTKKISIRREVYEIIRISRSEKFKAFCPACRCEEEFYSLDDAASFSKLGTRNLLVRIQSGEIHTLDATNGLMLVCAGSILGNAA